jgi:acetyl-CoA synthetase
MMMREGADVAKGYDFSSLRFLASVGEPLNPEAVVWSEKVFGQPFHDNWWQTETGGIMIANAPAWRSSPAPWASRCRVSRRASSRRRTGLSGTWNRRDRRTGAAPRLAVDDAAYLHEQARYDKCFATAGTCRAISRCGTATGYFWFVGRADDLIKTSGHLIGPFEVESALIEHEAVAEAGVIGVPDETAGEVVKAYVTLNPGFEAGPRTSNAIRGHARKTLGPAVAPREIVFRKTLPKTRSGKIMRRL